MTTVSQEAREAEVTQADRDALEAIDDALGFLMDNEREIVLAALARHRQSAERGEVVPRYRHKKRGTVYEVIGEAELQINIDNLVDGSEMVVYRGEDGKLWVRNYIEFHDGRFEPITTPPEAA